MISFSYAAELMTVFVFLCWNTRKVHCFTPTVEHISGSNSSHILLDMLNVAETALYAAKQYTKDNTRIHRSCDADCSIPNPMDCAEIYERNTSSKSGIYTIWPRSRIIENCPIKVYCEMEDDGGGWTVIQRRGDFDSPADFFYRDWISYKKGFGDFSRDFWLGNDNIFALTNERANSVKFILSDWESNTTYAIFEEFWIDDEMHNYTAHVSGYRGTAGDSFSFTNGNQFTTKDKDNDKHDSNCAVIFKGAWWYVACHSSNLNGKYLKGAHETYADGVEWSSFRGQKYSLKDTVIKIRPRDFTKLKPDVTPQ